MCVRSPSSSSLRSFIPSRSFRCSLSANVLDERVSSRIVLWRTCTTYMYVYFLFCAPSPVFVVVVVVAVARYRRVSDMPCPVVAWLGLTLWS